MNLFVCDSVWCYFCSWQINCIISVTSRFIVEILLIGSVVVRDVPRKDAFSIGFFQSGVNALGDAISFGALLFGLLQYRLTPDMMLLSVKQLFCANCFLFLLLFGLDK